MTDKLRCPQCGKIFTPHRSDQKYCSPNCRDKYNNGTSSERRRKREEKAKVADAIKQFKTKDTAPIDEFVIAGKSLCRLAKEAKAFGMSYGEYMMRIRCGDIERVLKMKGITDWKRILREI